MAHHDDARLADALAEVVADGDTRALFRRLLQEALQELIEAELSATIGARRTSAPSRARPSAMAAAASCCRPPAGDVELRIPKVKVGSFFPSLLEPRRRVDRASWAVIMQAYVHGTSTRKVDDLVRAQGCDSGVSKSTVSRICSEIDAEVEVFRQRRLDHTPFPYVFCDATYVNARVDIGRRRRRAPRPRPGRWGYRLLRTRPPIGGRRRGGDAWSW